MLLLAALLACTTTVPPQPPDLLPGWFADDSSYAPGKAGPLKGVVSVVFKPGASRAAREAALAKVRGCVIGGVRAGTEGYYFIFVPAATTPAALQEVVTALQGMPAVGEAELVPRGELTAH